MHTRFTLLVGVNRTSERPDVLVEPLEGALLVVWVGPILPVEGDELLEADRAAAVDVGLLPEGPHPVRRDLLVPGHLDQLLNQLLKLNYLDLARAVSVKR